MKITIFSDFACPYCYIGEKRLQTAIIGLGMEKEVDIELRAFELDPGAAKTTQTDTLTRFALKYHMSKADAEAQIEHISSLGREEGIDFRYATARYTNTLDAHRLMKLAETKAEKSVVAKLNWNLFAAYFTDNLELANHNVLLAAGQSAGLNVAEITETLNSDRYADAVRADEAEAARIGVRGVPFFIFEDGVTIPGAISTADMRRVLTSAKASAGGSACGIHGCVI